MFGLFGKIFSDGVLAIFAKVKKIWDLFVLCWLDFVIWLRMKFKKIFVDRLCLNKNFKLIYEELLWIFRDL